MRHRSKHPRCPLNHEIWKTFGLYTADPLSEADPINWTSRCLALSTLRERWRLINERVEIGLFAEITGSHFFAKVQKTFGAKVTTPTFVRHRLHPFSLQRGSFDAAAVAVGRKPHPVNDNNISEARINVVDRSHRLRR